jgi:hypothetical protein
MSDKLLGDLAAFTVEVEDLGASVGIDVFSGIPEKADGGSWHVVVRFTNRAAPPPLSIHVTDGMGSKDKVGG